MFRIKRSLFLLTLLLIGVDILAQQEPNLAYPSEKLGQFESLQSSGFIKSLSDFKLHGFVKSIDETVTYSGEKASKRLKRTKLLFNKEGFLTLFENDTAKSGLFAIPNIKKYEFDESGTKLLSFFHYHGMPQNHSTTTSSFDDAGFLSETIYKCTTCGLYHSRDSNEFNFDYTLTYSWNETRDTVHLDYEYVTDCTTWSREKDGYLYFSKKAENRSLSLFDFMINGVQESFSFDANGNINRITRIDNTIKSSFNIDTRTDYEYNQYQELVSIKQYSRIQRGNSDEPFYLDLSTDLNYLERDVHQNWIKMEVKITRGNGNSSLSIVPSGIYLYERKIEYY